MSHICLMKRGSTLERIERLDQIKAKLKLGEPTTMGALAADFSVSLRTLSRDIQILKNQGLPIDTDIGRGGGIRLDRMWGIGRINLNYAEAVDLLVSLAVAEQMNSPLFMGHLSSVRNKLMASFSPDLRVKARGLKARILIAPSASHMVMAKFTNSNRKQIGQIHQSFLNLKQMKIHYRAESKEITKRIIEPHYLLLSYPVWYVIAWDHLREDIRIFRCDRVTKIQNLEQSFKLLAVNKFDKLLEYANTI